MLCSPSDGAASYLSPSIGLVVSLESRLVRICCNAMYAAILRNKWDVAAGTRELSAAAGLAWPHDLLSQCRSDEEERVTELEQQGGARGMLKHV